MAIVPSPAHCMYACCHLSSIEGSGNAFVIRIVDSSQTCQVIPTRRLRRPVFIGHLSLFSLVDRKFPGLTGGY